MLRHAHTDFEPRTGDQAEMVFHGVSQLLNIDPILF